MTAKQAEEKTNNSKPTLSMDRLFKEVVEATDKRIEECAETGVYELTVTARTFYMECKLDSITKMYVYKLNRHYQELGYRTKFLGFSGAPEGLFICWNLDETIPV